MKYALLNDTLNFTWDQLAVAFWHRHPNPKSTHVLSVDTLFREVRPDGTLFTRRLIKKKNSVSIPYWGERIAPKHVYVIEESLIDRKRKTLTSYTRNISATSSCVVDEKCVFKPASDKSTLSWQRQFFVTSPIRFVGSAVQSILLNGIKSKTAPAATAAFNYTLKKLYRPWELQAEEEHHMTTAHATKELIKGKYKEGADRFHESKEKLKESKDKKKEALLLKKDKLKESAHLAKERSKETFQESKEKLKESKDKSKEALLLKKDKLKESAHLAKERSKETFHDSRDRMREKAQEAAKRTKVYADSGKKEE